MAQNEIGNEENAVQNKENSITNEKVVKEHEVRNQHMSSESQP